MTAPRFRSLPRALRRGLASLPRTLRWGLAVSLVDVALLAGLNYRF